MKKSHFSDEQIVKILSSVTDGTTVREVCGIHRVTENTFYTWTRKYADMESDDVRKLKDLQSENQAHK
jgi:putative transposase